MRAARAAARFRRENAHMIGMSATNAGALIVGAEWDTCDGFRVRQIEAQPNPREAGHWIGTVEVIGFAATSEAQA